MLFEHAFDRPNPQIAYGARRVYGDTGFSMLLSEGTPALGSTYAEGLRKLSQTSPV
jgi:hypothetical protein